MWGQATNLTTGVACRQGTFTPPDTWFRPFLDLHIYVLPVETNPFSKLVVTFPDYSLRISLGTFSILLVTYIEPHKENVFVCVFVELSCISCYRSFVFYILSHLFPLPCGAGSTVPSEGFDSSVIMPFCPPPFAKARDIYKTHSSVCLSLCYKNFNLLHIFWSIMVEHWYLACMILVTSPFNWHHALALTFDLLQVQGQTCCRAGDHSSPNWLVPGVLWLWHF